MRFGRLSRSRLDPKLANVSDWGIRQLLLAHQLRGAPEFRKSRDILAIARFPYLGIAAKARHFRPEEREMFPLCRSEGIRRKEDFGETEPSNMDEYTQSSTSPPTSRR